MFKLYITQPTAYIETATVFELDLWKINNICMWKWFITDLRPKKINIYSVEVQNDLVKRSLSNFPTTRILLYCLQGSKKEFTYTIHYNFK